MTEKARRAKKWLSRVYFLGKQLESDQRMLEAIEARLAPGAARYDTDGTENHDPEASKARHEEQLIDYSIQKEKVEKLSAAVASAMTDTRRAIDLLDEPEHIAVAIDRYVNRLKWEDIATLEHISIAKVYRVNAIVLEKLADTLNI